MLSGWDPAKERHLGGPDRVSPMRSGAAWRIGRPAARRRSGGRPAGVMRPRPDPILRPARSRTRKRSTALALSAVSFYLRRAAGRSGSAAGLDGRLAQLVEQLLYTQRVGGSSPSPPTRSRHGPPARRRARGHRPGAVKLFWNNVVFAPGRDLSRGSATMSGRGSKRCLTGGEGPRKPPPHRWCSGPMRGRSSVG